MGVALYVVAQKEVPGLDVSVDGKAIGKVDEQSIDAICDACGVASLVSFLSQAPEELADLMGEEVIDVDGDDELPEEEWFDAAEGLATVRGMIAYLTATPASLPGSAAVVEDLHDFERVLAALAAKGVKWHLAVDI